MAREPWDITADMVLGQGEVDRLLAFVRSRTARAERESAALDRLIIELLLFTGLRCSEACGLALRDIRVTESAPFLSVGTKHGEARKVWVPSELAALIQAFVTRVRPRLLPAGVDSDDPESRLLVHERGGRFERTGLYRRVVRVLEQAGLGERASVQLLRHTYGYLAYLRTGGNLLFVQRQLGHAHPMITSLYARLVAEDPSALAQRVAMPGSGRAARSDSTRARGAKRVRYKRVHRSGRSKRDRGGVNG